MSLCSRSRWYQLWNRFWVGAREGATVHVWKLPCPTLKSSCGRLCWGLLLDSSTNLDPQLIGLVPFHASVLYFGSFEAPLFHLLRVDIVQVDIRRGQTTHAHFLCQYRDLVCNDRGREFTFRHLQNSLSSIWGHFDDSLKEEEAPDASSWGHLPKINTVYKVNWKFEERESEWVSER